MNKKKKIVIGIIIFIIPFLSGFFIWEKKENKIPYVENIIESKIDYSDFYSYVLNFNGEFIYTDSYTQIDVISGEVTYPEIFSTYRMMTRWENKSEFVEFVSMSISPDDKYLVLSKPIKASINRNTPDLLVKSKIIDLQTGIFKYVNDDFLIFSWNPINPNLLVSTYGLFSIKTENKEITLDPINFENDNKISNEEIVANGAFIWDKKSFSPIANIGRIDNLWIIRNSDFINKGFYDTLIELFEQKYSNGENIPVGFDLSGNYLLYLKNEFQVNNQKSDSSLWVVDSKTGENFEIFRMSEYDQSKSEIVNLVWSTDNSRILIEEKNGSFLILELSIP